MEEKEIKYIPYGTDEIDYNLFITNAANEVLNYVNSQSWSNKRKESFLNAYLNLISQGITGASNDTGVWRINHNGDIPLETMSKRDREMYGEAAYFLRLQMSRITPRKKEEEKKKEDLEKYDFTSQFLPQIWNNRFGGNDKLFASEWENLDERGENGLRGTDNRKTALKEELTKYKENLINNKGKYNFEGTAFKDEDDVIRRIDEAIAAIDSPDLKDDNPKLNALGLSYNLWFSNGGNDVYGTTSDGRLVTYQLYYENQLKEALEKAKTEAEAKKQAAYNNTLFFNRVTNSKMLGQNPQSLKLKYGTDLQLRLALYQYSQGNIRNLTPDLLSEILGAYRYLAKDPIDNKLLKQLLSSSSGRYAEAAPNRFRKINGIDNLIWDNLAGQVIQINNRQLQQAILNQPDDLFKGVKTLLDVLNDYMNSTEGGFTPAELREVAALLFDLGAAVNPEGFSSTGLSQIASGIRDYNRASDPEGWTWGDTGWATLDHGLGLLSAIPVVGGLIKGSWAATKLGSYIPKMEKWIRLTGRAGSTYAMATNASGALNTLNKIKNGEDLSLKDYLDLAYFFIGSLGHHQLNRGNRIERSAMKARGVETSNSMLNRAGITRTKAKTTNTSETTPTLKVLKTGEDGKVEIKEIPIDKEKLKILSKTKVKDLEAKAKELNIEIPEGYKILPKSTTTKTWSRENLNRYWGKANSEIFGTQKLQRLISELKSNEEFEQYLSEHNNTWLKKFFNGSNRDIRRYDRYLGNNNRISNPSEEGTPKTTETKSTETPKINRQRMNELKEKFGRSKTESSNPKLEYNLKQQHKSEKEIELFEKSYGTNNSSSKNSFGEGYGSNNNTIKNGELNVDLGNGIKFSFKVNNAAEYKGNSGKVSTLRGLVAKKIQEQLHNKNVDRVKVGKLLKDLKRKGWLKQGGTINNLDTEIKEILKTL